MAFVPLFTGLIAGIDLKPSCTDKGRAGEMGDYGRLQAVLFDAYFASLDRSVGI
jgi:hypothetical protein